MVGGTVSITEAFTPRGITSRILSAVEAAELLVEAVPRYSGVPKFLVSMEQLEIDIGRRQRLVVSGHPEEGVTYELLQLV